MKGYRLKPEPNPCWVNSDGLYSGCSYYYIYKEPKRTEEPIRTVLLEPNRTGTESGTGTGTESGTGTGTGTTLI